MHRHLAPVDTAHNYPDEDPPRAEERDDAMEAVVGGVSLNIGSMHHLALEEQREHFVYMYK